MSLASTFIAQLYRLPPAEHDVLVTHDISIEAKDGVALKTDLFQPDAPGICPTILMRMPYGRTGFGAVAEIYAERGYNTVLQACRGTDGSGGEFDPLSHERDDGLATLDWIKKQDWFDGRLGITGPSYLGYAQWAICDALPELAAMSTKVSSAEFETIVFPGGAFHLQLWLSWLQTVEGLRHAPVDIALRMVTGNVEHRTDDAADSLPLIDADVIATGEQVPFWRRWFNEAIDNPKFWEPLDHTKRLGPNTPPNHFVSGWYDFMLDQLLRDYQTLVDAGQTPYLTIGTWHHLSSDLQGESLRATLIWMDSHLLNDQSDLRRKPVRIHISGRGGWREFDQFPPPGMMQKTLHLHAAGKMGDKPARAAKPDTYRYDPADPTPNLGGAIFAFTGAGPRDNKSLEERKDVLTYTSDELTEPLTIIGNPGFTLYARSSLEHTDFFARLCDVDERDRSTNICDTLIRLKPGKVKKADDGTWCITLKLHATAHRFQKGHRLRLQISSGAHPRYARNLGTGEPIGTATKMRVADQEILHDPQHPSALELPVWPG